MEARPIQPLSQPPDARLELPGSKSWCNRALVCAALSGMEGEIANLSPADDVSQMLNLLADLGWQPRRTAPASTSVRLSPPRRGAAPGPRRVFTGEGGTTTRFACALLAAVPGEFVLDASARMRERPMAPLLRALRELGTEIEEAPGSGMPLRIRGGSLRGGRTSIDGSASSQFLSALLLVAPGLPEPTEIVVEGDLVSRPYVEATLSVMHAFGLPEHAVSRDGCARFAVRPAPYIFRAWRSPPDATGAGYFWAAAAVCRGRVVIDGLTAGSPQSDVRLVEILSRMGCRALAFSDGLGIDAAGVAELQPVEADLSDLPDSAQTLAVVCAFAHGRSRLTGLSTLRHKETDRLAALHAELAKLGVASRFGDDWLEIDGAPEGLHGGRIAAYNDHRMAMSFAVAGLGLPGVEIENPACVSKSFPDFWQRLERLRRGS